MSIRIRVVDGISVAVCAAETDAEPGDIYLDDGAHYALAAKFCLDWQGQIVDWSYPEEWAAMESQKKRDAKAELIAFLDETPMCAVCGKSWKDGELIWCVNRWLCRDDIHKLKLETPI